MRATLVLAIAIAALVLSPAASAVPPANDAFADATAVASLPFSDAADLAEATVEGGEPGGGCWPLAGTTWYRLTPSEDSYLRISTSASFDRTVNVYRQFGTGFGGLSFVGCGYSFSDTTVQLSAGETYFVQVGRTPWAFVTGTLSLSMTVVPPPPNDAFVDAHSVASLPFSEVVDMQASTAELGEPTPSGLSPFQGTAWWTFTAPKTGPMLVMEAGCCGNRAVGVYTGGSLGSLAEVPVTRSFGRAIFTATSGTTYMIQLGHYGGLYGSGLLGISLQEAPNVSTAIFWSPFDPSSFDAVQLFGHGFDPAAFPIDSWTWDFGDGGSGTGQSVSHRYLADGDYDVTLTVRTVDGRTGTSTQTVSVRTHDAGITKLTVPQAATVGQTRSIGVSVLARRYDETVTVTLYRSVPGGFAVVGSSAQSVAKRKRATPFTFSYTFTVEDAAVGAVTFKAVATINGARDALPADNEIVALPTKVNG
jgi:PKD domain